MKTIQDGTQLSEAQVGLYTTLLKMSSASGSTTISTHTSTTKDIHPSLYIAVIKGWSGKDPNILHHNDGLWADLLGNKTKCEKLVCIKLKFLNPFSQMFTRFTKCPLHAITTTLLNFEF
jgi:hypothetical protein